MNVFTRVLLFSSFAHCLEFQKFMNLSDNQVEFGKNREKIANIFERVSTVSVLLKNYDQQSFEDFIKLIFNLGQPFLIIKFPYEQEWEKHCKVFQNDSIHKIAYYERQYQKIHDPLTAKNSFQYSEGFEPMKEDTDELDSQDSISTADRLPEWFYESLDRWYKFEESGYTIFCSFKSLELSLGCLVKRAGSYVFVIEKKSLMGYSLNDVSEILKKAWKKTQNLKLFFLMFDELYVLNPFKFSSTFGILEKLTDKGIRRNLKNLHKYPLRVEMFESAYSIEKPTNSSNFTGKLDCFFGPDVQVAQFIEEQMNASSN